MPPPRPLKASERRRLATLADLVGKHTLAASEARKAQNELWMELLKAGVSKTEIAAASGITHSGLNLRLKGPKSG